LYLGTQPQNCERYSQDLYQLNFDRGT